MANRFYVVQIINFPPRAGAYRIIEKMETVDGPRDRITSRTFSSEAAANDFINEQAVIRG